MPSHFDRFRLLNPSDRPVKRVAYQGHGSIPPTDNNPAIDQPDISGGQDIPVNGFIDNDPPGQQVNIKSILVNEIVVDDGTGNPGPSLLHWPLYFEGEPGIENSIHRVDVTVIRDPSPAPQYFAIAQLIFADYSVADYVSPWFQ